MDKQEVIDYFGTARKLAEALGLSESTISKWGDTIPSSRAYQVQAVTNNVFKVDEPSNIATVQLVNIKDGELKTNSKVVADCFGKAHRDVIRAIKLMECPHDFRVRNFAQSYYLSEQNKKITCFDMTRDGFVFLCMGFTGKYAAQWKIKYIEAFNEMENGLFMLDKRMAELDREKHDLKFIGAKWSEFGRQIKERKRMHLEKAGKLLDDVQLKLEY